MACSYKDFVDQLTSKLEKTGYHPIEERFPVAGKELEMNGLYGLASSGRKSYVVCTVKADRFAREQHRYLSDQFYNALAKELNQLSDQPTKLIGVCLFTFEAEPPKSEVEFLLTQPRNSGRLAAVRSVPWIVDLSRDRVQRPRMMTRPFEDQFLIDCMTPAGR